jgi:predicted O-methyltransferase YrrM
LWGEAEEFGAVLRERGMTTLQALGQDPGAGGEHEFVYWLTRLRQPAVVVETGVAAGWTSQAFLAAMERNGRGRLYSSDFPLFRLSRPEQLIGCVVDPALRGRWELLLEGDRVNLPKILARVPSIDLFHYDSDKSYPGREFAVRLVQPRMTSGGLILMDDVRNNSWFFDEITRTHQPHAILGHGGRYGVLGEIPSG